MTPYPYPIPARARRRMATGKARRSASLLWAATWPSLVTLSGAAVVVAVWGVR